MKDQGGADKLSLLNDFPIYTCICLLDQSRSPFWWLSRQIILSRTHHGYYFSPLVQEAKWFINKYGGVPSGKFRQRMRNLYTNTNIYKQVIIKKIYITKERKFYQTYQNRKISLFITITN